MGPWKKLLLPAAVILLAGCTTGAGPADPADPPAGPAADGTASRAVGTGAGGCGSRVETGPLPEWARTGFSGDARMPHVMGENGDIVAALFGHPLRVARTDGSTNKILWVARPTGTSPDPASTPALQITATRDGTDTPVTREVAGGPGPSIIDLPRAGCWHLELRWSGRTDTMDLVYARS
ncbi:hypothetical protein E1211_16165 [Micromonospora sp. 15K316]|uniref:hypothetical protein n=1 Tax=Micromonospora sp. 15K316 TaxID=2530376 RepID=UPI0010529F84|nr:hypothetical protein [Micromonospora sp. 15K316]TDC35157.1 hypothetical protein E1211_16165 [Micromonospora sp. 15K316]